MSIPQDKSTAELSSTYSVDFSGPSKEKWDEFLAWVATPEGQTFIKALREGKHDFRSPNPEEWT